MTRSDTGTIGTAGLRVSVLDLASTSASTGRPWSCPGTGGPEPARTG